MLANRSLSKISQLKGFLVLMTTPVQPNRNAEIAFAASWSVKTAKVRLLAAGLHVRAA